MRMVWQKTVVSVLLLLLTPPAFLQLVNKTGGQEEGSGQEDGENRLRKQLSIFSVVTVGS